MNVRLQTFDYGDAMVSDAGGVALQDGGRMRTGRVFRVAGGLVGPDEVSELQGLGLRTFVDLRGRGEDRSILEEWAKGSDVEYVRQPVDSAGHADGGFKTAVAERGGAAYLADAYRSIVEESGAQIAAVLREIAKGQPAAFGCAAGKDRTGMVNACLQILLGASEEDVVAFYVERAPAVADLRRLTADFGYEEGSPEAAEVDAVLRAEAPYMMDSLARIRDGWGGVEHYLRAHGLESEAVDRLRADLTER